MRLPQAEIPAGLKQLGKIMQLAFVPEDIEAATRFWTQIMGVGPFFVLPHIRLDNLYYRGEASEIDFSIRIAYWGDLQIELIEQHNTAPSIYRQAGAQHGLHHVCLLVDDIKHARELCANLHLPVIQEGTLPGGGAAIYIDTLGGPGTLVEILQPAPGGAAFFAFMQQASIGWHGDDPVRVMG